MSRLKLLPENQISDLLASVTRDVRDIKLLQRANTTGLVFYESQSAATWDFSQTVATVGGGQSAPGVPLLITANASEDVLLLGDLIIDSAFIDSSPSPHIFYRPASPTQKNINAWRVFMVSNTIGNVLAQIKCRIVANTDITIDVEYAP